MGALENYLQQTGLSSKVFATNSRYSGTETKKLIKDDGENIIYLKRRFIPSSERYGLLQEHTVAQGERPDLIANHYLGDPEQFWQLCDANNVMHPDELTETVGRKIRITLPEGILGYNNA
jgi:hypothetical protein